MNTSNISRVSTFAAHTSVIRVTSMLLHFVTLHYIWVVFTSVWCWWCCSFCCFSSCCHIQFEILFLYFSCSLSFSSSAFFCLTENEIMQSSRDIILVEWEVIQWEPMEETEISPSVCYAIFAVSNFLVTHKIRFQRIFLRENHMVPPHFHLPPPPPIPLGMVHYGCAWLGYQLLPSRLVHAKIPNCGFCWVEFSDCRAIL